MKNGYSAIHIYDKYCGNETRFFSFRTIRGNGHVCERMMSTQHNTSLLKRHKTLYSKQVRGKQKHKKCDF